MIRLFRTTNYLLALALLTLLGGASGCGKSNDVLANVHANEKRPTATSRSKIMSIVRDEAQREKQFVDDFLAEFTKMQDDASANAALDRIEQMLIDFRNHTPPLVVVEMNNDEYAQFKKDMKAEFESVIGTDAELRKRFENIGQTAAQSNLSLTTAMRFRRVMLDTSVLGNQGVRVNRQYPDDQLVTVVIQNTADAKEFMDYMKGKYKFELTTSSFTNGMHTMTFGAVPDMDAFVGMVDLGTVARTNERTRALLVELSDSDLKQLKDLRVKRLAEEDRKMKEAEERFEAAERAMEQEAEASIAADVQEQITERDKSLNEALRALKRMTNFQAAMSGIDTLESVRRDLGHTKLRITMAKERYIREVGKGYAKDDTAEKLQREIQTELDRVLQDQRMRVVLERRLGQNLDATSLLYDETNFRGYANPAEDSGHPDYLVANLLDLKSSNSSARGKALKRLATVDVSQVTDKQLYGDIARAIRDIATSGDSWTKKDAIMPLAVWGGKFSVPMLLKMLEEEKGQGDSELILAALAKNPTPESAEAVAKYVGNFFVNDEACQCLVQMGSVAEDAVIAVAPSDNPEVSLAAVLILGEIGTEKSIPLLRKATKSRNQEVKQAATGSIRKIQDRTGG